MIRNGQWTSSVTFSWCTTVNSLYIHYYSNVSYLSRVSDFEMSDYVLSSWSSGL